MTFDPLVEERVAPNTVVTRSERGNPLIVPRHGTVPEEYTRASYLANFLTVEGRQLSAWRQRYGIQGVARFKDLAARAAAVYYSTGPLTGTQPISARRAAAQELDAVFEEACERMGINEAANLGTAGHSLTEPANQGQVPDELADVVAGYNEVTMGLERVASEVFVVCDELKSGGTFDSVYLSPEYPGWALIGDTKTGKNYHQAEFEIQLASYSRGEVYLGDPKEQRDFFDEDGTWHETGLVDQRLTLEEYLGLPVHPSVGLLVHTSVTGSPKPRVIKLDLDRGWRLAKQAAATRDARAEISAVGIGEKMDHKAVARMALDNALKAVGTREDATALWRRFKPIWTEADGQVVKDALA